MTTLKQQIVPCLESTWSEKLVSLSQIERASALEMDKETVRMSSPGDFRQQLLAQSLNAARKSRADAASNDSTAEAKDSGGRRLDWGRRSPNR